MVDSPSSPCKHMKYKRTLLRLNACGICKKLIFPSLIFFIAFCRKTFNTICFVYLFPHPLRRFKHRNTNVHFCKESLQNPFYLLIILSFLSFFLQFIYFLYSVWFSWCNQYFCTLVSECTMFTNCRYSTARDH